MAHGLFVWAERTSKSHSMVGRPWSVRDRLEARPTLTTNASVVSRLQMRLQQGSPQLRHLLMAETIDRVVVHQAGGLHV